MHCPPWLPARQAAGRPPTAQLWPTRRPLLGETLPARRSEASERRDGLVEGYGGLAPPTGLALGCAKDAQAAAQFEWKLERASL